ncbi:MAG: hypothetical protein II776_02390 [Clostridia bacterium]|nr:hypothetical protein [Clostridia bacterium]
MDTELTRETGGKSEKSEKKSFAVFDLFLLIALALAVSLLVYFRLETPYGNAAPRAYSITLRATLSDWEEELVPVERQKILDEDGAAAGRVIAVSVITDGNDRILILNCEWERDLPMGKSFRLETADLVKTMRIINISEIAGDGK